MLPRRLYTSIFFFSCFVVLNIFSVNASAQNVMRIAAVVNDDLISAHDLGQRIRMTIMLGRMQDTPQVRQRLGRELLQTMISERLKKQEAERLEIEVTDEQLQKALGNFARAQQIKPDMLKEALESVGIDHDIVKEQAESEIGWTIALRRQSRERLKVSDKEISDALSKENAQIGKPEYRYQEIYLPVDFADQADKVKQFADQLLEQISKGSPFEIIARDFSKAKSAASGGKVNWVVASEVEPEVANALNGLSRDQLSKPIRTVTGYYILKLKDRRTFGEDDRVDVLDIAQAAFPMPKDASKEAWDKQRAIAANLLDQTRSCTDLVELGKKANATSGIVKKLALNKLPVDIRSHVKDLEKNEITMFEQPNKAVLVLMTCERVKPTPIPEITKKKRIEQRLFLQKLAREERRLMNQLRRTALVDIRL